MSAQRIRRLAEHEAAADRGSLLWWAITELKLREAGVPVALRTNIGLDIASAGVLAFNQGGAGVTIGGFFSGTTATAPTASTFTTDAVNLPANSVVGQMIVTTSGATRFGIVQSNTSATNSVLTIDRWYDATALPADPGVAAASTPTAGAWMLVGGNAPCSYMALANNATATAPAVTDTALTGEIVTAGGGLIRKLGTYAHSASSSGSGTVTLTKTWTANGSDSLAVTVSQVGVFQGVVVASSRMFTKTALSANATMTTSGDQVQVTHSTTVT
jgi:hypothetical protein